jgi:hypothetical protein
LILSGVRGFRPDMFASNLLQRHIDTKTIYPASKPGASLKKAMVDIQAASQPGTARCQLGANLAHRLQISPAFVNHFPVLARPTFRQMFAHAYYGNFPPPHGPNLTDFQGWTVPHLFFRHPTT